MSTTIWMPIPIAFPQWQQNIASVVALLRWYWRDLTGFGWGYSPYPGKKITETVSNVHRIKFHGWPILTQKKGPSLDLAFFEQQWWKEVYPVKLRSNIASASRSTFQAPRLQTWRAIYTGPISQNEDVCGDLYLCEQTVSSDEPVRFPTTLVADIRSNLKTYGDTNRTAVTDPTGTNGRIHCFVATASDFSNQKLWSYEC